MKQSKSVSASANLVLTFLWILCSFLPLDLGNHIFCSSFILKHENRSLLTLRKKSNVIKLSQGTGRSPDGAKWTHSDIKWRISPSPETPFVKKLKLKLLAKAIRADCFLKNEPCPPILCPKGGRAVLEGYKNRKKIAKFGITTTAGPPSPQIDETIKDIYGIDSRIGAANVAAIIYMFVEPEFRSKGIGILALEAIAAIQTVQGCDFTVLVADDDGSGKLVDWYEKNGFTIAPKLQDIFGSPGGKYGKTMIRPTSVASDIFARCKIKWW